MTGWNDARLEMHIDAQGFNSPVWELKCQLGVVKSGVSGMNHCVVVWT